MDPSPRIPVTVLTGYLGAGKTTLLNRILAAPAGRRYAVIVNEFGEIGIDHELIVRSDEELFEMNNGCVCCTVRGDLIRTLHALLARPGSFDAIVVETTGLADPGPVAQTFFVDPQLQQRTRLDSVTTVVDAAHIALRLADSHEAAEQIAFADQVVLNKVDRVEAVELAEVERQIRALNPLAPILNAERANVPLDALLGRGGFDLDRIVALEPDFLNPPHGDLGHEHDEHCGHEYHAHDQVHDHIHASGITSVSLSETRPMDAALVERWLTEMVALQGADILRAKGIVDVAGEPRRMVFQAVQRLLEGDWQRAWREDEVRGSRLVFIGRRLDEKALRAGFAACVAASA